MKVLITGGGGFIGGNLARRIHEREEDVTVLSRRSYASIEEDGIRAIQADIRDVEAVSRAVQGMDAVFHVAGLAQIWGRREDFWTINVEGTRNVLAACRRGGVRKLILTSSPSVVFGPDPICGADESQPYPSRYSAHYPESKAVAEAEVLAANGPDLATVAIRPHLVWGPGDPHLIPRIIDRARRGRLVQVGDGQNLVDVTYVDNAVEAHVLALDALGVGSVCAGKAYFISQGEPVRLWPWLNELLARLGVPLAAGRKSFRAARRAGAALELLHGVFGLRREPEMTRFLSEQLAHSHYFNIEAARRDLGYRPVVSTEEGVRRLVAHYRTTGLV